jgi:DNA-binding CsgD family transcriptional regulator
MAKRKERQRALKLRKQGKSYGEIKKVVKVSKSTLSRWLRAYPLGKERIRLLRDLNEKRIEKYRQTMQAKREKRLKSFYQLEKRRWIPLSKRELYMAGLFLYWGEGVKSLKSSVSLNNTDPKVVKFYLYWLTRILGIPRKKIRVYVHLYNDMKIDKELKYWSRELKIPLKQFNKPYIKKSKRVDIDHKGFGHGTCALAVHNTRLKEKIMLGIEAIADYYSGKV